MYSYWNFYKKSPLGLTQREDFCHFFTLSRIFL